MLIKKCFDCNKNFTENEGKLLIIDNNDKLVWHFYCISCLKIWRIRALKSNGFSDLEIKNKISKEFK